MLPSSEQEWHYEPQLEFLQRHGLLSAREKRILERRSQEPSEPGEVVKFGRKDDEDEDEAS